MCNCGSRRQRMQSQHAYAANGVPQVPHGPHRTATVEFAYIGRTAVTAIGPVTGATYRFHSAGARVHVDVRDASAIAQIPVLRRV